MSFTLKRLNFFDKGKILEHFLRLDVETRISRFCTNMSDELLKNYVNKMDFNNGIFGLIDDNLNIIGLGECVFFQEDNLQKAEVGFTVEKEFQNQGLGNRLMRRIVQFSQCYMINELKMYCLRTNTVSLHLAKKYNLKPCFDGPEAVAIIKPNNLNYYLSIIGEQIEESCANLELFFKINNKIINSNS